MEDIVALKISRKDSSTIAVMAWGRVGDAVKADWLLNAYRCSLSEGEQEVIESIRLCDSLQEVAKYTYFFEGLFWFTNAGIPFGKKYDKWKKKKFEEYESGYGDFYDLGTQAP